MRAGVLSLRFGACTVRGGRGVFAFFGIPTGYGLVHTDLAVGTVDGRPVLGRTVAAVRSSLGPPGHVGLQLTHPP